MNDFVIDKVALVNLEKSTFADVGDCKKALAATNNNFHEAVIWLRKHGLDKASAEFGEKIANEIKKFVEAEAFTARRKSKSNSRIKFQWIKKMWNKLK